MGERQRTGRRIVATVVLWVLLWVAVVASGSWVVWTVISAAGGQFVGTVDPVPSSAVTAAPPASGPASSRPPRPHRTTATPVAPDSTSSRTPTTQAPPTTPHSDPVVRVRTRTWSGAPGVVTVRCVGARISLGGAAATASGYAVEVNRRGAQVVEVEFRRRPDGRDTRVTARCRGGSPVFSVAGDD